MFFIFVLFGVLSVAYETPISKEIEQVKEQGEQRIVGFEMNGFEIQEAENVPSDYASSITPVA